MIGYTGLNLDSMSSVQRRLFHEIQSTRSLFLPRQTVCSQLQTGGRVRAEGEVGVYADKTAAKPAVCFKLNQDYAVPLLKALAVVIGMVALFKLFDD